MSGPVRTLSLFRADLCVVAELRACRQLPVLLVVGKCTAFSAAHCRHDVGRLSAPETGFMTGTAAHLPGTSWLLAVPTRKIDPPLRYRTVRRGLARCRLFLEGFAARRMYPPEYSSRNLNREAVARLAA